MEQPTSIPVPITLKELIASNNLLLSQYQKELTEKVIKTMRNECISLCRRDLKNFGKYYDRYSNIWETIN